MKNRLLIILPLLSLLFLACDDEVSYSDMKDRESRAIKTFLRSEGINVISFNEFIEKDSITDIDNNEYVQIDGVYMQIIRNPKDVAGARKIREGETMNMMARFYEYNILDGDTINGNIFDTDNNELAGAMVDMSSASSSRGEYINEGYFFRAQYNYG
ncbi:MAG: DUF4827 family protein, partial [Bacteroidaceae bacterium]|nr:DUF4827 family protein [Bacteroidaceae bacterium]